MACEHGKAFFIRAAKLPPDVKLDLPDDALVFVVPKFHVGAHKEECQGTYSPNYTLHVARWDGEGVERLWWRLHACAPSTREMGRGSRWETIDDFCGFSNWRKTVQFGENAWALSAMRMGLSHQRLGDDLLRLQLEALPAALAHQDDFEKFDSNLRKHRPHDVSKWEEMVLKWEGDRAKNPSPFLLPKRGVFSFSHSATGHVAAN